jgi:hypothetical protein
MRRNQFRGLPPACGAKSEAGRADASRTRRAQARWRWAAQATPRRSRRTEPYRLLIRTSLALALGVGFSIGFYLIVGFAFGLPLAPTTPAPMQVHGQVQSLGFVALFIMAVGVQLFHVFTPLDSTGQPRSRSADLLPALASS